MSGNVVRRSGSNARMMKPYHLRKPFLRIRIQPFPGLDEEALRQRVSQSCRKTCPHDIDDISEPPSVSTLVVSFATNPFLKTVLFAPAIKGLLAAFQNVCSKFLHFSRVNRSRLRVPGPIATHRLSL